MFIKKKKSSSGLTLIDMTVSVALMGVLGLGVAIYIGQQQDAVKRIEATMHMNTIRLEIEKALIDPKVIQASALLGRKPGNILLKNCIVDPKTAVGQGTKCDKAATDPKNQVTFDLILPPKQLAVDDETLEKLTIAGDEDHPALYRLKDGTRCKRGSTVSQCDADVKVRAYFWATCPPEKNTSGIEITHSVDGILSYAATTCLSAETINLRFQIVFSPHKKEGGLAAMNIPNMPPDRIFWLGAKGLKQSSTFGAITIPVNTIPGMGKLPISCPTNSTIKSIKDGVPLCECEFPYKPAPGCVPGEVCACISSDKTCKKNERYRGMNTATGEILCCPVHCEPTVLTWSGGTHNGCKPGGWMESVQPLVNPERGSSCYAEQDCSLGKWGGSCETAINCMETVQCCYEYVPSGSSTGMGKCNSGS